jgi:hypothetical protein
MSRTKLVSNFDYQLIVLVMQNEILQSMVESRNSDCPVQSLETSKELPHCIKPLISKGFRSYLQH